MTVAGQRIVAVCEDNTVNVYDAVTGVLKSSLNPPQQVTKAESSPDGSILFFAHQQAHEITVWDTQTGGLARTFATTSGISDIGVSSEGKYLGSCSFDGTFEFWRVEGRCGGSRSLGEAIVRICWLKPENQVALVLEEAVVILEVATGMMLRRHRLGKGARELTFSPHRDQFAVLLDWKKFGGKIETIDIETGITKPSSRLLLQDVSHFTFCNSGSRIIYVTGTGHLRSYTLKSLSGQDNHVNNLRTIRSMNSLRSGHLVVNCGGSIQIFGLEYTGQSGATRDSVTAHVYQLDSDKAICGSSRDHTDASLLDTETMKTLVNRHVELDASFAARFLCASISKDITFLCFRKHNGFTLKGCKIDGTSLWEVSFSQPVLLGALSPDGWRLIVVSGGEDSSGGGDWELFVLEVCSGKVSNDVRFIQKGRPPSKIGFTSWKQFYIEERQVFSTLPRDEDMSDSEDHHIQTTSTQSTTSKNPSLHPQQLDVTSRTTVSTSTTNSQGQSHTGVYHKEYCVRKTFSLKFVGFHFRIEEVSREEMLTTNPYALDENLEWVVDTKSRRVCWLPPDYVTGIKYGHFFVGSSIVTAGKDGVVRNLTFREPESDS